MTIAVLVMRRDGSKQFFPGCHIAGYWDGDLVLSKGEPGVGLDVVIDWREPISGIERVELVSEDADEPGDFDRAGWEIGTKTENRRAE